MAKNAFNSVEYPQVGSNTFDLSHDVKMSFKMGGLYPTLVMDCIPGDRIRMSSETMLRFAPMLSPIMHRVNVTTHYFFVPNRILWSNWEDWITGNLDAEAPYFTTVEGGIPEGSLLDYLGVPTGSGANFSNLEISAFPFAAYTKIFDEYYRDQNLVQEEHIPLVNGLNTEYQGVYGKIDPLKRAWMHDYFTAALPFAQKGDAVSLPLFNTVEDVPITYVPGQTPILRQGPGPVWNPPGTGFSLAVISATGKISNSGGSAGPLVLDPSGSLVASTSDLEAGAATINTLRRAFRLQEWLEKNARGGTRYIENIMAHFGVKSSDARLQRPEFLGGSYQKMVISEVLSTAETVNEESNMNVGYMAGHGIAVGSGKEFTYRVEEHGWILGIINVQPVTAYQQGLPKMYSREDRLDYLWPTFANIGEQEVLNKEVYVGDSTYNAGVFGYVPRYSEYRFISSRVAGEMRTSLNHWHMGRIFETPPNLNETFVSANPSTRVFAVEDPNVDHIYGHIFNDIKALRKLPKFGTPQF